MTADRDTDAQDQVLGPLIRVIEEAADHAPWALIGGSGLRLQRTLVESPNLEFMAPATTVEALSGMLQLAGRWEQGQHLAATRLHFLRHGVPVFVFADPVFHGRYDSLKSIEILALGRTRARPLR
jgi:ribosome biogenesis protein Tsr3